MRTLERLELGQTPPDAPGWQSHIAPAHETEQQFHLPGGISGNMKELLANPSTTTRSLQSAQAVMHAVYRITGVDERSRSRMQSRIVRDRMGIVLDLFRPRERKIGREILPAEEVEIIAERSAQRMIETAAVIWNHGTSNLGPIEIK